MLQEIKPIYIECTTIYTENDIIDRGSVLLDEGKIQAIYREGEAPGNMPHDTYSIDGRGYSVIPGFIDAHIHGAGGADVMDATEEALGTMAEILPLEGTTAFQATTITQAPDNIEKALANVAAHNHKAGQAELIGIHLEGPFVEKEKAGAQPVQHISAPDMELFRNWQALSGNNITTITLAPELDANGSFIQQLRKQGVNISAGHTAADFEGMQRARLLGVAQMTHLCNAMEGIHHRGIGAVGAAFLLDGIRAELIADGIHVVPEMLQLIYNNMGSDRVILITDAMRAKWLPPGSYDLGGQSVNVTEDRASLENGSLAGSILKMDDGARNMLELDGVSMRDIINMTAVNPSKQLRLDHRKGSVSAGKDADILVVDDELGIKYTICGGIVACEEGSNGSHPSERL